MKRKLFFKKILVSILLTFTFIACQKEKSKEESIRTVSTVDIDSLNPYQVVSSTSEQILLNVFEGLIMPGVDGTVVPALAESYEISEDGKTYTFSIRKGVKFHNGNNMDIKDVEFSLNYMSGKLGNNPTEALFENIEKIEILDDSHIAIHLSKPDSSFIYYMKEAIVPDENKDHLKDIAIGTGPYKIAEYQKEQKLVLSKNEEYWGEKAKISTVTILISPNSETNFLKLLSGEINFLTNIDPKRIPELDKYQILSSPSNLCLILSLNPKEKPFDDIEVRKAINLAIDKNKVIQLAMNGKGSPIYTNMSPVMSKFLWSAPEEQADSEKAKQILEQKKLLPMEFTLKVPNSSKFYLDTAQSIREQLKDIGITVNLEMVEWATWLSDVYTNRKYVASLAGLSGKMEPDAILRRYTSTYAKNFTNFNNTRYDVLVEEAKRTSNEAKQIENYKEAQKILSEEQAAIFLMDPNIIIATEKGIEGFEFYPLPYLNFAKLYFKK